MNTFQKVSTRTVLVGMTATALLLSGCTDEETANIAPLASPEASLSQELKEIDQDAVNAAEGEIAAEEFQAAFKKYVETNQKEFGTLVIESANAVQSEMQAEQQAEQQKLIEQQAKNVRDISETDHIMGNKDAEFVLFEYSDYHCPYCTRFHPTTKEFLEKNEDVAVVLRPYPGVHTSTSSPIHEIAECVAKEAGNDAFWSFTDIAFEKGTALTPANYTKELETLKIENIDKITACYDSGEFKEYVQSSETEGKELGIQGTPGSILKNMKTGEIRFVGGAYPLEELERFKTELTK